MSGGAERFVVNRAELRAALSAVAPFAAKPGKDAANMDRLSVIAFRYHLVVTAQDRFSWAAAAMLLQDSVPGVDDVVHELRAWSIDAGSAKAVTQVICPPSDKDARSMWESMDAQLTFDGDRVHVEEVGEFTGGREVAVEVTVEVGPAASAAPARAVPAIAAALLEQAPAEADERRVPGDRLAQMQKVASSVGDVIRYAHRGDWLVGTCGERLVMGVYAPAEQPPRPGSGDPEPGHHLDRWHGELHTLGRAIRPLDEQKAAGSEVPS